MIFNKGCYVIDTSSFRVLSHYYPSVMHSLWKEVDKLVQVGKFTSVREVHRELAGKNYEADFSKWYKKHRAIFTIPSRDEQEFVGQILDRKPFDQMIPLKHRRLGGMVADPFIIAKAKMNKGVVVTEEKSKNPQPNALDCKIPTVCRYYGVECINFEGFMQQQNWVLKLDFLNNADS